MQASSKAKPPRPGTDVRRRNTYPRFGLRLACALLPLLTVGGCVDSLPTSALPTVSKSDRTVLTKDEQAAAIGALIRNQETEQAAALKEINKGK